MCSSTMFVFFFISHARRAVFVHLEKCAGTYVSEVLCARADFVRYCVPVDFSDVRLRDTGYYAHALDNAEWSAACGMDADKWREYFTFTFVRDPDAKMRSGYAYLRRHALADTCRFMTPLDKEILGASEGGMEAALARNAELSVFAYHHLCLSPAASLQREGRPLALDFVGHVETIESDLARLLDILEARGAPLAPDPKTSYHRNERIDGHKIDV